ncbi:hypothetical protein H6B07_19080, partial [Mediterraneibacter glycyrrhizinilyticus]|nr:hypothetical protein [Mediterraneibacter glycyrrhizinilyticus]
ILSALGIPHIHYEISQKEEIDSYLSEERKQWIEGVGEVIVNSVHRAQLCKGNLKCYAPASK